MKKWSMYLLISVLWSFFIVNCFASPVEKDTLIIGIPATPRGWDAESGLQRVSHQFLDLGCDTGLRYSYAPSNAPKAHNALVPIYPPDAKLLPSLFESWEMSSDGKTITWHLRKGVKSPYGNEFTTEDIKWFFERCFALKATMFSYATTQDVQSMDQIDIIDKYTWSMTASQPNPMIFYGQASFYYVFYDSTEAKKHATSDDPWASQWIDKWGPSFGPYYVTKWQAGKEVVFQANPNYWGGPPKQFETIIYKVIPESSTRVAMIKNGTIDIAQDLSYSEVMSLRGEPGIKIYSVPKGGVPMQLTLNWDFDPFKNKLVRKAILYAIPRKAIVDTAFYGFAQPWEGFLPLDYPGCLSANEWPYHYDIDKAKQLLEKAGYSDGFSVELYYTAGVPYQETTSILVKNSLEKIGIDVKLIKAPLGPYVTGLFGRKYQTAYLEGHSYHVDPSHPCFIFAHSESFVNLSNYKNTKVDAMIEEGRSILDLKKRIEFHKNIQRKMIEDPPFCPVVQINITDVVRDNIKGWNASMGPNYKFNWMYTE